jgi:hypothetical protein
LPLFTPPHAPFLPLIIHGWYNGPASTQAPTNSLPTLSKVSQPHKTETQTKQTKIKTTLTGITEEEI